MPRATTAELAETVAALQQTILELQQQVQRDVIDRLDVINGRLESALVRAAAAEVPKPAVPGVLRAAPAAPAGGRPHVNGLRVVPVPGLGRR